MNLPKLLPKLLIHTFIFCLNTNYSNANKSGKKTWKVFPDENAIEFNHLAVDEYGRWVYIGAVNRIYQLSTDLELQINYTISELSRSDCTAPNCIQKLKRNTTTFNGNEVLALDYQNQQLISCGTFFKGICHAHDINNISKIWLTRFEPIVESHYRHPTVAFIAPSLSKNSTTPLSTLYVGFTPVHNETSIQTVTIKNLEREYFSSVLTQNTAFHFTRNVCPTARNYDELIYGFSSENVGYFIAGNTDPRHLVPGYIIKADTHKNNSCNRVAIICTSGGTDLTRTGRTSLAYFQKGNPDSGSKTGLHETEEKLLFTVQTEYINDENGWAETFSVCRHQINELDSLIQKDEPLRGDLIFSHPPSEVFVSAMAVTSINNHTILFLGNNDGRLLKISIKGFDSTDLYPASKYADITIDAGTKVHSDMLFDSTMNFLYVMTRKKLTKVKIHSCDEYNTSDACLVIKDPYCGWCFLSNRCCLKSECDFEQNHINWVSYDINKYIDASSSPADKFSRTAESNVTFKVITRHLFINHTIICLFEFGNFSINTTSICNKNSINCVTPPPNNLPPTPLNSHSIGAELSVQTNHFPVFKKILIQFFDCTTYKSCLSCMSSPYPCKWYVNEFRCTDNAIWKQDDIVIGMNSSSTNFSRRSSKSLYDGNKFSKNALFCPQFFTKHESDIYISAHTEKTEQIQVYYKMPSNLQEGKLICKFVFDSKKERTQLTLFGGYRFPGNDLKEGDIKCNDEIFTYTESIPFITVELSVLWNASIPLDNTYNTHIVVYKCAHMGDQCTACLNKNYSCMWNSETEECKYYSLNDTFNITDPWLHDIQKCSNSTIFQKNLSKNQSTNWLTENIYLIIALIITVTVVIVAVFVIRSRKSAVRSRKMQQQINKMGMEMIAMSQCVKRVVIENEIELDENESTILKIPNVTVVYESYPIIDAEEVAPTPRTEYEGPRSEYELPLDEKWEIPRENVVLGEFLGEGEFGRVVKGNVSGLLQPHIVTTAAVKMLKTTHKDTDMVSLVTEMELLKLIGRHDNVLSLLGCCTQNGPLLVIIEYSPHGNLLDFLRNHHQPSTARENDLSEKVQLTFALQIATGMEYLASMRLIHRDLAARNILIFDEYVLKIADFGLAKDIRNSDYYKQKSKGRFPVKWIAPETITHRRHSTKSDVWSYGILLWEIVTFGEVPYAAYDDAGKLLKDIRSGYRLKKPEGCSMDTYCLMVKCWNHLPENRPDFTRIIHDLEAILKKMDPVIEESYSDCSSISSVYSHKANETNRLL
ncbi:plexin-A4-like [Planococcus citri]|uniref:plexin-A4-like n=1 Tax=Planococcus citri TaxID=170843 RepID=UPI0031F8675B